MKKKLSIVLVLCLLLSAMGTLTGCKSEQDAVSVQSVSMILGYGSLGRVNRYAGMVCAGKTQEINLDEGLELNEIKVEEGQDVKAGDLLFTYDNAAMLLDIEQSKLEIEGMQNSLVTMQDQLADLEEEKEKASDDHKLEYTLQIESLQADQRETEYNIAVKQKELEMKEAQSEKTEVYAEVNGRVTEINKEESYDNYGNKLPFMTVIETGQLRIKGTINEMNMASLFEGSPVVIRSRTDDAVWTGVISSIDWENPVSDNNNYYYGYSDEMTTSSKYPFYVQLDSEEGLFIGQHVYIEEGTLTEEPAALCLPSYFVIVEEGTEPYVWAMDAEGNLEKRTIGLGAYLEDMDCYEVTEGLSLEDYLAFPEEGLKEGQPTVKWDETMFDDGMQEGYDEIGYMVDDYYEGDPMNDPYMEEEVEVEYGD